MGLFRKSAAVEPLGVTMAAVKLGERMLAVGARNPTLTARLAVKAGLTGRACVVDDDEARLAKAAAAIEQEGALSSRSARRTGCGRSTTAASTSP